MQVLWGENVTTCILIIMDVNITWLAKNNNEKFGKLVWVLCCENIIECNMQYSYVGISYLNKHYVYC